MFDGLFLAVDTLANASVRSKRSAKTIKPSLFCVDRANANALSLLGINPVGGGVLHALESGVVSGTLDPQCAVLANDIESLFLALHVVCDVVLVLVHGGGDLGGVGDQSLRSGLILLFFFYKRLFRLIINSIESNDGIRLMHSTGYHCNPMLSLTET